MGRRCACDRLLDAMRNDPRLRVIPAAARYMWLALADALARLPEPGVFMLGSRVGSTLDIQLMLSMPEPEVETCLGILLETHLITRTETGALSIPLIVETAARSSTAAQNGRKSLGRPRKGETSHEYELRKKQREMPLLGVHQGGAAETQETQTKREPDNPPRARAQLASSSFKEEAKAKPREDIVAIGNQLAEIAGLDTLRGAFTFQPVAAWLAQGATPELLVEVVTAVASRPSYRPPGHLGYFNKPVQEAIASRGSEAPAATNPPKSAEQLRVFQEFNRDVEAYAAGGCMGPPPVPLELRCA